MSGHNGASILVYPPQGIRVSADVHVQGSSTTGNFTDLFDPNAVTTGVTTPTAIDVICGTRYISVELANLSGTANPGQTWTVIVTPYDSPGPGRVQSTIVVNTLAAIQVNTGALTISDVCTIGTNGGIYQGTGSFASPVTGLKIWNSGGIGTLATYQNGTLQVSIDTNGRLVAGGGSVVLDAGGLHIGGTTVSGAQNLSGPLSITAAPAQLQITDNTSGDPTPNKYIQVASNGHLQILNSAKNATLLDLDNSGNTSISGNFSASGSLSTSSGISVAGSLTFGNNSSQVSWPSGANISSNSTSDLVLTAHGGNWIYFYSGTTQLGHLDSGASLSIYGPSITFAGVGSSGGTVQFGDGNHKIYNQSDNFYFNTYSGQFILTNTYNGATATFYLNTPGTLRTILGGGPGLTRIYVSSNTNWGLSILPQASAGNFNPITQGNDSVIVAHDDGSSQSNAYLTLTTWSSTSVGFRINPSGTIQYWGSLASQSDERLKTVQEPITSVLPAIRTWQPVRFTWRDPDLGNQLQVGLIAQDVQKDFPELVTTTTWKGQDYLGLDYARLATVLVAAVQELDQRLSALEAVK